MSAIRVTGPMTIKAFAKKTGMKDSGMLTARYTITATGPSVTPSGTVFIPLPNYNPGKVNSGTRITLSTSTPGAKIYYTTDGSTPDTSTPYMSAIPVTGSVTIKAFAVKEGMKDSAILTASYTIITDTPTSTDTPTGSPAYTPPPSGTADMPIANPGPGEITSEYPIMTYTARPSSDSQGIEFIFPKPVNDLTENEIKIINGSGEVVRGSLEGSGTVWKIWFSSVIKEGYISVMILKAGISSSLQSVKVQKPVEVGPGIHWTKVTVNAGNLKSVAYGRGTVVAVGDGGKIFRSTDNGATWTAVANSGFGSLNINAVAYGGGAFVAVGNGGAIRVSTDDGVTWGSGEYTSVLVPEEKRTIPGYWDTMTAFFPIWVPKHEVTIPAYYTTESPSPFGTGNINAITFVTSNTFIAAGDYGKIAWSRNGGLNWTETETSGFGSGSKINTIATITTGGLSVSYAGGNSGQESFSEQRLNYDSWHGSSNSVFGAGNINAAAFMDRHKLVIVGDGGKIAWTTNASRLEKSTWYLVGDSPFGSSSIRGVAYGGGFFAVGDGGKMAWSEDGVTWTDSPLVVGGSPTANRLNGIVYVGGIWVVVGDGGVILRSQ
jgi:photosystem II stability/assembly factor-like uncharacterized protein